MSFTVGPITPTPSTSPSKLETRTSEKPVTDVTVVDTFQDGSTFTLRIASDEKLSDQLILDFARQVGEAALVDSELLGLKPADHTYEIDLVSEETYIDLGGGSY